MTAATSLKTAKRRARSRRGWVRPSIGATSLVVFVSGWRNLMRRRSTGTPARHTDTREPTATGDGERDDANPAPVDTTTRLAWLRTQFAAERTLMAWNRTSISLIGFGFTIYSFLKVQEGAGRAAYPAHTPRNVGLALVVAGTLAGLIALYQHRRYTRYLQGHRDIKEIALREGMPARRWHSPSRSS